MRKMGGLASSFPFTYAMMLMGSLSLIGFPFLTVEFELGKSHLSKIHVCRRERGAVVTPFVQVATYATRNFATLGQLELLPPFTGASIQSL
ncbi:hypothetical protein LIER_02295 [Lithospermum erythrorhizon]|uniref:Uncharacterized protein n=1 Tax=Lithospermum erythrorhizon TaxID=34254 RepID=A0AAV3NPC0_LITER